MRLGLMYLKGKDYEDYGVIAPLSFGYLGAYLQERLGFEDFFLEVENIPRFLAQSPDIIGLSSFTETFETAINYARYFKELDPHVPILVGGEHISAIPESLPDCIDIGVLGEGEETIVELMRLYQRGEADFEHLSQVKGIIFWHQGRQILTEARPWIAELDSIPMPNREMLLKDTKWQQPIFTARGCPYKCTFCASTRFWQKTRYHSVQRVVAEIEYIVQHFPQQRMIPINDDLFPLNKDRMRAIVDAIREKGLHNKVGFSLNARASVFDEEIARMIVAMNGQVIGFGLESASDRILTALKGKTSARDNLRALDICERFNLPVVSNLMLGSPEETPEDLAKSYWFVRKNEYRFMRPAVAYSTPFPGTEFWQEALRQGVIDTHFERWNILDLRYIKGESIYMNKHIPEEDFGPLYTRFREFQQPLKQSYQRIHGFLAKRHYFQALYPTLVEKLELSGSVLEIGFEDYCLADAHPHLQVTKLFIESGKVDLNPIHERFFDAIVIGHGLEKLRHPEMLLQRLHHALKAEGKLHCLFFNAAHPSFIAQLLSGHWQAHPFGVHHPHALRFFTPSSLRTLLQSHRWSVTQLQDSGLASHADIETNLEATINLLENELGSSQDKALSYLLSASSALNMLQYPHEQVGDLTAF